MMPVVNVTGLVYDIFAILRGQRNVRSMVSIFDIWREQRTEKRECSYEASCKPIDEEIRSFVR